MQPKRTRPVILVPLELGNPNHDELGRFAPDMGGTTGGGEQKEFKVTGKQWKQIYALPADGKIHDLPGGLRAVHYPATKIQVESVLVENEHKQCLRRRLIRNFWNHPEVTEHLSRSIPSEGGYFQPPELSLDLPVDVIDDSWLDDLTIIQLGREAGGRWITVNGTHIFIRDDGGAQREQVARFFSKKRSDEAPSFEGHTPTRIVSWMGREGFNFQQARAALARIGLHVNDASIRGTLRAHKREGHRVEPADLTRVQQDYLRASRKEGKPEAYGHLPRAPEGATVHPQTDRAGRRQAAETPARIEVPVETQPAPRVRTYPEKATTAEHRTAEAMRIGLEVLGRANNHTATAGDFLRAEAAHRLAQRAQQQAQQQALQNGDVVNAHKHERASRQHADYEQWHREQRDALGQRPVPRTGIPARGAAARREAAQQPQPTRRPSRPEEGVTDQGPSSPPAPPSPTTEEDLKDIRGERYLERARIHFNAREAILKQLAGASKYVKKGSIDGSADSFNYTNEEDGIGSWSSRIHNDGKNLHINLASIDTNKQGKGVGTHIFASQLEAARKLGIETIDLEAARSSSFIGYKVWPRFGFDGKIPHRSPCSRMAFPFEQCQSELGFTPTRVSEFYRPGPNLEKRIKFWEQNGVWMSMELDIRPNSKIANAFLKRYYDRVKREHAGEP
jgi:hypothetical protein